MMQFVDKETEFSALTPCLQGVSSCIVIADKNAYSHHSDFVESLFDKAERKFHLLLLNGREEIKDLTTVEKIWRQLILIGADRKSLVINFGGGTICDMGGFAASCYMRGIPTVHIPTTLLAMIDAAIGGKTGINLDKTKNMIGSFHPPKGIIVCPQLLSSLPRSEISNGIAEAIKAAVIADDNLFHFLEEQMEAILNGEPLAIHHVIEQAAKIKLAVTQKDTYEKKERMILNFGHTFGHAIEAATGNKQFSHGEAVSIGMSCAAIASKKLGLVDSTFIDRVEALCRKAELPIELPHDIDDEQLMSAIKSDKKRIFEKFNLIVAEKVGKVIIAAGIEESFLRDVIKEKRNRDLHS